MFLDYSALFLIKTFQVFLRLLPEKLQSATGILFGRAAFFLLQSRRRIALKNIGRVFPHLHNNDRKAIALRCFENLGVNFIELLLIPFVPQAAYRERFAVTNGHYFDDALKREKGIVALVFHYANWEIMGIASVLLDHEVVVLARPLKKFKALNDFLNRLRSSAGMKIIPNVETARDVMKYLKENKIVAFLGDQREKRSRGVFVDFFGTKVPTNKGIAMMGMKTGAPVIPCYLVRQGFLRYTLICNEPLSMERKGDMQELISANTRKINAFLESIILKKPEEWFWVHRRWGRDS